MTSKISVLILCQNSEKTLERTLKSVMDFDEILILDGGSTDATKELARKYNARFEFNKFKSFPDQRNESIKRATHNWCLILDSDEVVTSELKDELYRQVSLKTLFPLYRIWRVEYLNHKEINTGTSKSWFQERFFQKDKITFEGDVHEYPIINGIKPAIESELVKNIDRKYRMLHNPDVSIQSHVSKIGHYSILKSNLRVREGKRTNPFIVWLNFNGTLLRILWKNRKEGKNGFLLAITEACHRCLTHMLIYEKQDKENKS